MEKPFLFWGNFGCKFNAEAGSTTSVALFARQLFDFHGDLLLRIKLSKCKCTSYLEPVDSKICIKVFWET